MSDEDVALEVTTLDHDPRVEIRGADGRYSITCYARRGAKTAVRTSLDEALSYARDFLTCKLTEDEPSVEVAVANAP